MSAVKALSSTIALVVSGVLATTPTQVLNNTGDDAPAPELSLGVKRAIALANRAQDYYLAKQYREAAKYYSYAHRELPNDAKYEQQQLQWIFQTAESYWNAYLAEYDDKSSAESLLRQAKAHFRTYRDRLDPQADRVALTSVTARLETIELELHVRGFERRRPRALLISGGAVLAASAACLGLMTFGLVDGQRTTTEIESLVEREPENYSARYQLLSKGAGANATAIAGGVVGGALAGAGVALVVLGKRELARVKVRAALGVGHAGLTISGRF